MLSTSKSALQAGDGRSLCPHACRHLALSQPRVLPCLQQSIKQDELFALDTRYLSPHTRTAQEPAA